MPLIEVRQAASMDSATRREVVRAVTEAYSAASGVPAAKVWVIVEETTRDHWGTGGRTLADSDEDGDPR